jgi:hypothetical protein
VAGPQGPSGPSGVTGPQGTSGNVGPSGPSGAGIGYDQPLNIASSVTFAVLNVNTSTGPVYSGYQNNFVFVRGVPSADTGNTAGALATNGIIIETSRNSAISGQRNQVAAGDVIGYVSFRGQTGTNAVNNVAFPSAFIAATAVEAPTEFVRGGRLYLQTVSTGTTTMGTRLQLDNLTNFYQSTTHQFSDASGATTMFQATTFGLILQKGFRNSTRDWSNGGTYALPAGTYTITASSATVHNILLGGNITLSGFATGTNGNQATLILTQDGTGGRTLSTTGVWAFSGGVSTLSVAPNSIDILEILYYGGTYYAKLTKGYS